MNGHFFISPPCLQATEGEQNTIQALIRHALDNSLFAYYLPIEDRVVITQFACSVVGGIRLNDHKNIWSN